MLKSFFILTGLALATTSVSADIGPGGTLTMNYLSAYPGRAVNYTLDSGTTNRNAIAAQLNWAVQGGGSLTTFCVQIEESVSGGAAITYDVVDLEQVPDSPPAEPGPMGQARAELIRDLYARNYETVMAATGSDARNQAAAFAIVIWEITHQDSSAETAAGILADLDLTSGNARFTSGTTVNTIAGDMLAGLGGGESDFLNFGVLGGTNPDYQDVLIVVPGPAGLAAIAGLGLARRRRRH